MAPTGPGPFWSPPSGGGGSAASTGGAGSVRSLADISTYDAGREDGSFLAGGVGGLHWEVGVGYAMSHLPHMGMDQYLLIQVLGG